MKNIFNIQIERKAEYSSAFPWYVKVENPIFSIQKRFALLPEVLAWLIEEVEKEKEDSIESPLSDIELNDIKLSEEEYTRGEAPVFDSIEDMLDHIGEEE